MLPATKMDAKELTDIIKPHALEIAKQANGGCQKAKNVIEFHRMIVSCPSDRVSIVFCEKAFKEWLDKN